MKNGECTERATLADSRGETALPNFTKRECTKRVDIEIFLALRALMIELDNVELNNIELDNIQWISWFVQCVSLGHHKIDFNNTLIKRRILLRDRRIKSAAQRCASYSCQRYTPCQVGLRLDCEWFVANPRRICGILSCARPNFETNRDSAKIRAI